MRGIKILMGILTILVMIGISLGSLTTPLPIVVKLEIPSNVEACYYGVKITNLRTGEVMTGTTNQYLEYLVDWANTEFKYQKNDIFRIETIGEDICLRYTAMPPTELVKQVNNEDVDYLTIEVSEEEHYQYCLEKMEYEEEEECPVCEECPICEICLECPDCNCEECPDCICPEDVTPYEKCDSCCPEPTQPVPVEILIGIILAFFGIGVGSGTYGYKFVVRKRKGTGKLEMQVTQHKHKNQGYYHSINTIHKKQPHKKGEINPKYDSYGRYVGE